MEIPAASVLIADDQEDVLLAGKFLLEDEGFHVHTVDSPKVVLETAMSQPLDVVLLDLNFAKDTTSGKEGLDLVDRLQNLDPDLPVVVMTAWASYDLAVEAIRRGARDFVKKPWENERLVSIVRNQAALSHSLRSGKRLREENRLLRGRAGVDFIAQSEAMQPILDIIERVSASDANVLITGENGTGKGLVAQLLHENSGRRERPFISVNLAGLSDGIFESELFGHVRGAFTDAKSDHVGRLELASRGTLFLDEIANVPLHQQTKLLHCLETGEFERVGSSRRQQVDVRLISATNADLEGEVREGRFREDLFYRLNTIPVHIPALRERGDDILNLAGHFLKRFARRYGKSLNGFSAKARALLAAYAWPGNVRELRNAIERAVLLCRASEIQPADLALQPPSGEQASFDSMTLEEIDDYFIRKTLDRFQGNISQAARHLGVGRSTLYRRLNEPES